MSRSRWGLLAGQAVVLVRQVCDLVRRGQGVAPVRREVGVSFIMVWWSGGNARDQAGHAHTGHCSALMSQDPHSWALGTRAAGLSDAALLMRAPRRWIRPWSPPPFGTYSVLSGYTSSPGSTMPRYRSSAFGRAYM